jgi:hypothetical protein
MSGRLQKSAAVRPATPSRRATPAGIALAKQQRASARRRACSISSSRRLASGHRCPTRRPVSTSPRRRAAAPANSMCRARRRRTIALLGPTLPSSRAQCDDPALRRRRRQLALCHERDRATRAIVAIALTLVLARGLPSQWRPGVAAIYADRLIGFAKEEASRMETCGGQDEHHAAMNAECRFHEDRATWSGRF